jgi:hypothetical protein
MAWNDSPPTKQELQAKPAWNATPPQPHELGQASPNKDISVMQSLGSGAAEGLTGGFSDEIGAAGKALMDSVTGTTDIGDTLDNYRRQRDLLRQDFKANHDAHPVANFIGNLGGSVALPAQLLKNASPITTGMVLGGTAGLGNSEAELTPDKISAHSAGQALNDTATGAAVGGVTAPLLNKILDKYATPSGLENVAEERAAKATGLDKGGMKRLASKKLYDEAGEIIPGKTQLNKYGRTLLDNDMVPILGSPSTILENAEQKLAEEGPVISGIHKQLDDSATKNVLGQLSLPYPADMSAEIEKNLIPKTLNPQGLPYKTLQGRNNTLNNIVEDINSHGNLGVPFEQAQKIKQMLGEAAYDASGKVIDEDAHKAYGIVNKYIENKAEETASSSGIPGLLDKYKDAKDVYGAAKIAQGAALNKTSANLAHSDVGLIPAVVSTAGAAAHGTPGAVAAFGAMKFGKAFGNSIAANTSNVASKVFALPKEGLQSLAQHLSTQGETGQKLGQILTQAAERDDIGKNALLFTLMQQGAYRNLINSNVDNNSGGQGVK